MKKWIPTSRQFVSKEIYKVLRSNSANSWMHSNLIIKSISCQWDQAKPKKQWLKKQSAYVYLNPFISCPEICHSYIINVKVILHSHVRPGGISPEGLLENFMSDITTYKDRSVAPLTCSHLKYKIKYHYDKFCTTCLFEIIYMSCFSIIYVM